MNLTTEEMIAVWGDKFFGECLQEARAIRQLMIGGSEVPIDLVLAVAVKKVLEMKCDGRREN